MISTLFNKFLQLLETISIGGKKLSGSESDYFPKVLSTFGKFLSLRFLNKNYPENLLNSVLTDLKLTDLKFYQNTNHINKTQMLEQIDKYLNNELSLSERQVFENQLSTDSTLAKELAFYANTQTASKQLANEKRKEQFEHLRTEISSRTVRKIKPMIWVSGLAASVVLALGFWWFSQNATQNAEILADVYIQEHFENLPVKMDGNADSLQMGLRLFNEKKLNDAQKIFEEILLRKNNDSETTKYAGITALKLQQYDKAIQYFQVLSKQTNLYSNPGKFYEALALMKQNKVDRKKAKEILNEVIINNLEGNEEARRIVEAGY